jgi:ORF6N domain-containing protein
MNEGRPLPVFQPIDNPVTSDTSTVLILRYRLTMPAPSSSSLKSQIVTSRSLVRAEWVERRILSLRGQKVMLSTDLAELYEVAPKVLMQAVKRNRERFPADFMFQLTRVEYSNLKSQFVTSSWGGARRAAPYAFTEQGVAMLSSVLRSPRAVQVNIAIMRAFVKLREILATHRDLARRLDEMESKYDKQFRVVFDAIRQLMMAPPEKPRRRIGFAVPKD